MKKRKPGRQRIGQPISITLTDDQREWIDGQIDPGGTRTEVIRQIIQETMVHCGWKPNKLKGGKK